MKQQNRATKEICTFSSVGTLAAASVPESTAKRRLDSGGASLRTVMLGRKMRRKVPKENMHL